MSEITKMLSVGLAIGGLIFTAGKQSEKIDELFTKAQMASVESKDIHDVIYDMHGKVCAIERDIQRLLK